MRALGVLLFVAGSAAAGFCVRGMFSARRPRDLLFALAGPVAVIAAVLGLLLAFAPAAF